ncbi:hypothetical protein Srufu_008680 [Streptomyces libani subsp. rufus]|nr:hypothetical protein Srufu_008680 [Streptomyces libani subsp. rufus]
MSHHTDRTDHIDYKDVVHAAERINGKVRPVTLTPVDSGTFSAGEVWLALEFMQHTGSFKARGALNFTAAHIEDGTMPDAGVVIASGGNAGLACAWAAAQHQVPATVFLPQNAPAVKVSRLTALGAEVRLTGTEYHHAMEAAAAHAEQTGALASHAYDNPYIAAGAGTVLEEIYTRTGTPLVDTIIVAVGGGGLFTGVAAAAARHDVRVVAVEPENCRALNAAIEAGQVVDVEVDSVAVDSLGARRTSPMALHMAGVADVRPVLVSDEQIIAVRKALWEHRRLAVEHAAATALAALTSRAYLPAPTSPSPSCSAGRTPTQARSPEQAPRPLPLASARRARLRPCRDARQDCPQGRITTNHPTQRRNRGSSQQMPMDRGFREMLLRAPLIVVQRRDQQALQGRQVLRFGEKYKRPLAANRCCSASPWASPSWPCRCCTWSPTRSSRSCWCSARAWCCSFLVYLTLPETARQELEK